MAKGHSAFGRVAEGITHTASAPLEHGFYSNNSPAVGDFAIKLGAGPDFKTVPRLP
jgi:hypothetical protein